MSDDPEYEGSLFSLFEGEITGKVKNRLTGNIHDRKDVLCHYHYLVIRSVKNPANIKLRRLVRIVADLLDIPSRIHEALIIEAWKDPGRKGPQVTDPFIKADMEAAYSMITGEVYVDLASSEGQVEGANQKDPSEKKNTGLMDQHVGIYDKDDADTYSLLKEMYEDDIIKDPGSSIQDTRRDSPFFGDGWGRKNEGNKVNDHTSLSDLRS